MSKRPQLDTVSSLGPFGAADAANDSGRDDFVDFDGIDGIATRHDDLRARVIVGRKGAGKTLYLRRARQFAADSDSLYADDVQQNLPGTTDIVRVANLYPKGVLVEKWMAIWRCAILRSLATHMLHNKRLGDRLSPEDKQSLREDFPNVMLDAAKSKTPLSVYSQVKEIANHPKLNQRWLDQMIAHREWEELEYRLGELLDMFPQICFYIDAVDEEFRHAPAYWLMCQKGLFYQVMRLLRDTRMDGRLHIFICIRDLTYASVFGGEHATRYLDPLHIRILEWDTPSIEYLFEEKIDRLDRSLTRGRPTTIAGWLGTDVIHNVRRDFDEPTARYALRHTRLLPRDIVVLGNRLCAEMLGRGREPRTLSQHEIRQVVSQCASLFGREQLEICANQITADMMHEGAALHEISELYTGSDPTFHGAQVYLNHQRQTLSALVKRIGTDRFSRDTFLRFQEEGAAAFQGHTDPMAVLWQNGLLGLVPAGLSDGRAVFYSASAHHDLWIDDAAPRYAFHPCLIDALSLTSEGPGSLPVTPVAFNEV